MRLTLIASTVLMLAASASLLNAAPPFDGYAPASTGYSPVYYSYGPYLGTMMAATNVVVKQGSTVLMQNASGASTTPFDTYYGATVSPANLVSGAVHTIEVTMSGSGSTYPTYATAWIDYNNDGDFLDAGEYLGPSPTSGAGTTVTITFTAPTGVAGTKRLRIRTNYSSPITGPTATGSYGEGEDYLVGLGFAILTPSILPSGSLGGVAYSTDIVAGDGTSPYTWQGNPTYVISGALPAGLTATPMGTPNFLRIAGTPNGAAGTSNFTVSVTDGAGTNQTAAFQITIFNAPAALPFSDDFSTDKGWAMTGLWERNPCQAYSATGPNRSEPGADHSPTTDNRILGHDLGDDYANNMNPPEFATSPPVNCSSASVVRLRFWRYLGCSPGDNCKIHVTNNGSTWVEVWASPSASTINETAWTSVSYDITAYAAGNPVVQVRFQMGPTDATIVNTGWCIDDLVIEEPVADLLFQENGSGGAQIIDNAAPAGIRDFGTVSAGTNNAITIYMTNNGPSAVAFGGGGNPQYTKTGANPGQYYMPDWNSNVPNPLQPGQSASFTIVFNSGAGNGTFTATIEIYHNASFSGFSPFQINLTATAIVPQPIIRVNVGSATGPQVPHQAAAAGTARDFGNHHISAGPTAPLTIFVTNAGTGTLAITTPQMGGTWWTEYTVNSTGTVSQLAAGASTSFTVAFDPTSIGQKGADILISHSDGTQPSPFYIPVTGVGVSGPLPAMALELGATPVPQGGSHNAGALAAAVPTDFVFTIRNNGTANLNLTGAPVVQISSQVACTAVVTVSPASTMIVPAGTANFTVQLTPVVPGGWSFLMSIANDDPLRNPYLATVFGTSFVSPTELRVITQPIDSAAGSLFAVAPVIAITDAAGNVAVNDNSTQVEVAITSGTGNASAGLSGTISYTAINGYVTFADLVISHKGNGYTLTFTDVGGTLSSAESDPFNVSGSGGGGDGGGDEEEEACSTGDGVSGGLIALFLLVFSAAILRRREVV